VRGRGKGRTNDNRKKNANESWAAESTYIKQKKNNGGLSHDEGRKGQESKRNGRMKTERTKQICTLEGAPGAKLTGNGAPCKVRVQENAKSVRQRGRGERKGST